MAAEVHVCLYCRENGLIQTCTALHSLLQSKNADTAYDIAVLMQSYNETDKKLLDSFAAPAVQIRVLPEEGNLLSQMTETLPWDRAICLDSAVLVREDLIELFSMDIGDCTAAVLPGDVPAYPGAGVLLLQLSRLRGGKMPEQLSGLANETVYPLPLRWALPAELPGSLSVKVLNERYGTNCSDTGELVRNAAIVRFSEASAPWKNKNTCFADEWYTCFWDSPCGSDAAAGLPAAPDVTGPVPCVTVVLGTYNAGAYIARTLDSICAQTLRNIEILCVDAGSADETLAVLRFYAEREPRVRVLPVQKGEDPHTVPYSAGIREAKGEYVYFMDADGLLAPDALRRCLQSASLYETDIVMLEAETVLETAELEQKYSGRKAMYLRRDVYPACTSGAVLFGSMVSRWDFPVRSSLRLYRTDFLRTHAADCRTREEQNDNYFSVRMMLCAERVRVLPGVMYSRHIYFDPSADDSVGALQRKCWEHRIVLLLTALSDKLDPQNGLGMDALGDRIYAGIRSVQAIALSPQEEELYNDYAAEYPLPDDRLLRFFEASRRRVHDTRVQTLESRIAQMSAERAGNQRELQALRKEKGERWQELQALRREKGERWQELLALRKEADALRKDADVNIAKDFSSQELIQQLRREGEEARREIERLRAEGDEMGKKIADTEDELRRQRTEDAKELQALRKEKNEQWEELRNQQEETEKRQGEIEKLCREKTVQQEEAQTLRNLTGALNAELHTERARVESLEKTLADMRHSGIYRVVNALRKSSKDQ